MSQPAQAAVVVGVGEPPAVCEIEVVDPVDDEVLIDIGASGICHTDLSCADGTLATPYPVVLGHEGAGVVRAVGPRVSRFVPGDRVVVSVAHHCGHCRFCESGYPPLCISRFRGRARYSLRRSPLLQGFGTGTFTSTTVLREGSLAPVPAGVPLPIAAATGCAVVTGMGAAINDAKVRPGSTVAVFGCGGVGASIIMGARISGAARIVAVDPNPVRRELATQVGATDVVEPSHDALRELEPSGYDYTFESAGHIAATEMAVEVAGAAGVITLVGLTQSEARLSLPVLEFTNSAKQLIGSNMGRLRPNIDFPAYFRLYESGRLPLDALIGALLPLDQAADAFALARSGSAARVLLVTPVEEAASEGRSTRPG